MENINLHLITKHLIKVEGVVRGPIVLQVGVPTKRSREYQLSLLLNPYKGLNGQLLSKACSKFSRKKSSTISLMVRKMLQAILDKEHVTTFYQKTKA